MAPIIFSVILIGFVFLLFAYLIFNFISEFKGAPFVPSTSNAVSKMLSMADLKPGMKLLDVGSGDGRIVFAAANLGLDAYGVDTNIVLIWWSQIIAFFKSQSKTTHFKCENIFDTDLSQYDVITLYCLPRTIAKLENKFKKEIKKGAIIASNTFDLKDAKVLKQDGKIRIYQY